MPGSSFVSDLNYSETAKNILKDVYKKMSFEGRFVFVNKGEKYKSLGSDLIQKQLCVDTVAQISDCESILVEEKFRRHDYGDLLIETASCTVPGREKEGWIYTSQADFLVYVIDGKFEVKIYIIDMKKLRNFYLYNTAKYPRKRTEQINKTEFVLVPFEDIKKEVGYRIIKREKAVAYGAQTYD